MLETDRLVLRGPQESDKAAVRAQLSMFQIAKWLAKVPHPYPEGHEDLWWERVLERRALGFPGYHMLVLKEGNHTDAIGAVAVTPLGSGVFRIGYWLDEPHWGKGLMSEAVACAIDHAFEVHKATSMVAGVFEGNKGSEAILRKSGFSDVDVTVEWCEARQQNLNHKNLVLTRQYHVSR